MFTLLCAAVLCFPAEGVEAWDGDTFRLRAPIQANGRPGRVIASVRLWGVNAPELDEPGGPEAGLALGRLIAGQQIACTPHGASFGRTVGECQLADGTDLSCAMVRSGYAQPEGQFSDWTYANAECAPPKAVDNLSDD